LGGFSSLFERIDCGVKIGQGISGIQRIHKRHRNRCRSAQIPSRDFRFRWQSGFSVRDHFNRREHGLKEVTFCIRPAVDGL
jgi:hypothetical protein